MQPWKHILGCLGRWTPPSDPLIKECAHETEPAGAAPETWTAAAAVAPSAMALAQSGKVSRCPPRHSGGAGLSYKAASAVDASDTSSAGVQKVVPTSGSEPEELVAPDADVRATWQTLKSRSGLVARQQSAPASCDSQNSHSGPTEHAPATVVTPPRCLLGVQMHASSPALLLTQSEVGDESHVAMRTGMDERAAGLGSPVGFRAGASESRETEQVSLAPPVSAVPPAVLRARLSPRSQYVPCSYPSQLLGGSGTVAQPPGGRNVLGVEAPLCWTSPSPHTLLDQVAPESGDLCMRASASVRQASAATLPGRLSVAPAASLAPELHGLSRFGRQAGARSRMQGCATNTPAPLHATTDAAGGALKAVPHQRHQQQKQQQRPPRPEAPAAAAAQSMDVHALLAQASSAAVALEAALLRPAPHSAWDDAQRDAVEAGGAGLNERRHSVAGAAQLEPAGWRSALTPSRRPARVSDAVAPAPLSGSTVGLLGGALEQEHGGMAVGTCRRHASSSGGGAADVLAPGAWPGMRSALSYGVYSSLVAQRMSQQAQQLPSSARSQLPQVLPPRHAPQLLRPRCVLQPTSVVGSSVLSPEWLDQGEPMRDARCAGDVRGRESGAGSSNRGRGLPGDHTALVQPTQAFSTPDRGAPTSGSGMFLGSEYSVADLQAYSRANSQAYGRAESQGCGRADSQAYGRADSQAYGRADSQAYGRADSQAYGRADSQAYGRADSQAYGQSELHAGSRAESQASGELLHGAWQQTGPPRSCCAPLLPRRQSVGDRNSQSNFCVAAAINQRHGPTQLAAPRESHAAARAPPCVASSPAPLGAAPRARNSGTKLLEVVSCARLAGRRSLEAADGGSGSAWEDRLQPFTRPEDMASLGEHLRARARTCADAVCKFQAAVAAENRAVGCDDSGGSDSTGVPDGAVSLHALQPCTPGRHSVDAARAAPWGLDVRVSDGCAVDARLSGDVSAHGRLPASAAGAMRASGDSGADGLVVSGNVRFAGSHMMLAGSGPGLDWSLGMAAALSADEERRVQREAVLTYLYALNEHDTSFCPRRAHVHHGSGTQATGLWAGSTHAGLYYPVAAHNHTIAIASGSPPTGLLPTPGSSAQRSILGCDEPCVLGSASPGQRVLI